MLDRHKQGLAAVAWVAALGAGALFASVHGEPPTRLTFLSVGQGDCTVFQRQGETVLIDAGPKTRDFDGGERIVVPALRRLGVTRVDLVLLSHPDLDHVGGLDAILNHFRVGRIAMPLHFRNRPDMIALFGRHGLGVKDIVWTEGDQAVDLAGFRLYLETPLWDGTGSDNEGSMFVKIAGEGASCVFSGDAAAPTELGMMGRGPGWKAQILHSGHHGSAHAGCLQWLQAVHPRFAVVSVGRNNRYGHPAPEVMERYDSLGVRTLRTDRLGDVTFLLGRNGFELVPSGATALVHNPGR